jgi:hypothetical protein
VVLATVTVVLMRATPFLVTSTWTFTLGRT